MSTSRTDWAFQSVWNWEQNTPKKCVFYIIAALRQFSTVCFSFTSALYVGNKIQSVILLTEEIIFAIFSFLWSLQT
jgi:hypothetical protein